MSGVTPQPRTRRTGPDGPLLSGFRRARRLLASLLAIGAAISGGVAVAAQERDPSVAVASGVRGPDPESTPAGTWSVAADIGVPIPIRGGAAAVGRVLPEGDGIVAADDDLVLDDHTTLVAHAVDGSVTARAGPAEDAEPVGEFAHPTEQGGPLVFQALGRPQDDWLEVLLPVRPNGTTGWIPVDEVELTVNPYRIEIDTERFRLTVLRRDEVQLVTEVGLGTGRTPTPIGDFYLMELLRPADPDGLYGPYAYGLSGYSNTLQSFNGGAGVIGIHGTNQPDLLGGPVSHGCIRVANETIEEMTGYLPLGTPVSISGPGTGEPVPSAPPVVGS